MSKKNILHMISPQENVSPFDVNMACDAGYDVVIPYTSVNLTDVKGLVQDAIFSRSVNNAKKTGVFICGTTGEGMSMTLKERKVIAKEWVNFQEEKFKVIVHVGTTSSKQSKVLAKHAQKIGAYGTSTMGPIFLKPNSINPLIDFCAEIAQAAPDIPFFYYHIPLISGINLSMVDYIDEAKLKIPNFSGIKYTHDNFAELIKCIEKDNLKWNILNGFDENLFKVLKLGLFNAVGSTYNYMYPNYLSMIKDFKAGKIEQAEEKISALEHFYPQKDLIEEEK